MRQSEVGKTFARLDNLRKELELERGVGQEDKLAQYLPAPSEQSRVSTSNHRDSLETRLQRLFRQKGLHQVKQLKTQTHAPVNSDKDTSNQDIETRMQRKIQQLRFKYSQLKHQQPLKNRLPHSDFKPAIEVSKHTTIEPKSNDENLQGLGLEMIRLKDKISNINSAKHQSNKQGCQAKHQSRRLLKQILSKLKQISLSVELRPVVPSQQSLKDKVAELIRDIQSETSSRTQTHQLLETLWKKLAVLLGAKESQNVI